MKEKELISLKNWTENKKKNLNIEKVCDIQIQEKKLKNNKNKLKKQKKIH